MNKIKASRYYLLIFVFALILVSVSYMLLAPPPLVPPASVTSTLVYSFNAPGVLNETGSMSGSTSPYWWLNSGGELVLTGNAGETMQGTAPAGELWHDLYARNNPTDTDEGAHPQNLFRLVTRSQWGNSSEQAQFYIAQDNFSTSPNRNASNGLLLMSRYADAGQTLYYAGVRVDGTAVIKKKYKGTYYTMAQTKLFPGTYTGTQDDANLLPHQAWLGLRVDTETLADGSVRVNLYVEKPGTTTWSLALTSRDSGQYAKTPPILAAGYMGIRTDFMDVEFRSFKLQAL